MRKTFKGCLTVLAVCFLLVLSCTIYVRHPHFSGKLPSKMEVEIYDFVSTNEYRTSITNPSACRRIMETLKSGTWTLPHRCKYRGTFTIHYDNGKADVVGYMPGHSGPEFCEIELAGHYQLSRTNLYQVMRDAGVDVSQIPVE